MAVSSLLLLVGGLACSKPEIAISARLRPGAIVELDKVALVVLNPQESTAEYCNGYKNHLEAALRARGIQAGSLLVTVPTGGTPRMGIAFRSGPGGGPGQPHVPGHDTVIPFTQSGTGSPKDPTYDTTNLSHRLGFLPRHILTIRLTGIDSGLMSREGGARFVLALTEYPEGREVWKAEEILSWKGGSGSGVAFGGGGVMFAMDSGPTIAGDPRASVEALLAKMVEQGLVKPPLKR